MDKKAYIIKVLETIKEEWGPAEGLMLLIQEGTLGENILDALIQMLQAAIEETNNEIVKNKLIEAQDIFEKIKAAEAESRVIDNEDIVVLEAAIANI